MKFVRGFIYVDTDIKYYLKSDVYATCFIVLNGLILHKALVSGLCRVDYYLTLGTSKSSGIEGYIVLSLLTLIKYYYGYLTDRF